MPVLASEATVESRIFNDITDLLERQRTEHVEPHLLELQDRLSRLYNSPGKANLNFATCQMSFALIAFGLGNHDEALRQASNAVRNGGGDMPIMANAEFMYANMGEFELARKVASETRQRFPGDFHALQTSSVVYTETLDFDSAVECLEQLQKIGATGPVIDGIPGRIKYLRDMSAAAASLALSADDLMQRAMCAARALRTAGRKLYWTELKGHRPGASTLEFFVDADPDTCADLTFVVAEALTTSFEETAVDVVTMSVRSYEGALSLQQGNVLELVP